ncbi:N-acetylmuramoyl-L-alanine amidase [Sporosarcina limicola]|uniref:N-acetylmuramoyl-L-alanine amidase n=1 Tax=Sporosarcina limicola TaxID=34101 RepID=A0A927R851_9BACL|nr:N-acetylmuramoyl-L-alanine amidase [Sporosarcina limicola]MBE1556649.1 N-acetylmuramoyl-L-alanine amidase [Sporosarcina limicola]
MRTIKWAAVLSMIFALVTMVPGHSSAQFKFSDVKPIEDFYEQVHYIADLGIINKAEKFNPSNNLTRAQAAKMLVIAAKKSSASTPSIVIKDINQKKYPEQYKYASKAVALGFFELGADNRFKPNEKLKRDEMGNALAVAFNLSEKDKPLLLTDMAKHEYANRINGLYYAGITIGDDGKFLPNDYLTRKQFALFVARALNDKFKVPVNLPDQTSKTYFAKVKTGGDILNVRSKPSVQGTVIKKLKDGQIVEVVSKSGDWLHILLDNGEGYINNRFTVEAGTETPTDEVEVPKEKPTEVEVPKEKPTEVEVPKEEPTEGEVPKEEPTEGEVPKEEPTEGEVPKEEPTEGEVPEENLEEPITSGNLTGKVTVKSLNVRESTGTNSAIIAKLTIGQRVEVLLLDGYWAKVRVNSQTGYVHKSYLKLINNTGNILENRIIVVDAGHGAHDPGTSKNKVTEKSITLKVAKLVEAKLKNAGAKVLMIRSDDTFLSLEQRPAFAKKNFAETFVSIHVNSAAPSAKGTETYFDSSTNPNSAESKTLATYIQNNLIKNANMVNRGVKDNRFIVIKQNNVAAVLVELGFISNSEDFQKLTSDIYLEIYAESIYQGLVQYYSQ